jgi:hypothetical protein
MWPSWYHHRLLFCLDITILYKLQCMLAFGNTREHGTNTIASELSKICQLSASCKLPNYFGNSIFCMVENAQFCMTS